jgi:Protein of unknown function (DUF1579)
VSPHNTACEPERSEQNTPNLPQPDPALGRLDRLVGTWTMEGNLVGSDEHNIRGETTFRWLPGGFFLEQRARIDFVGQQIDALELISYDPETDTFPSTVFSGFSPTPLPYRWDVQGDRVTITVAYAPLDATFTGFWREDGTFSGGWRPNPGADETRECPLRHRRAPSRIAHDHKERAGMKMLRVIEFLVPRWLPWGDGQQLPP